MKEQMAKMTIIELVRTAHNYSTSIKQTGVYSELVREMASRLEALNLAHIGAMAALNSTEKERDQLAAECAERKSAAKKVIKMNRQHAKDKHGNSDIAESWACVKVLRQVNTPATDRFLAEQRAQGVEKAAASYHPLVVTGGSEDPQENGLCIREDLLSIAAQLRSEVKV